MRVGTDESHVQEVTTLAFVSVTATEINCDGVALVLDARKGVQVQERRRLAGVIQFHQLVHVGREIVITQVVFDSNRPPVKLETLAYSWSIRSSVGGKLY